MPIDNSDKYNRGAKSIKNAFGAPDEDPAPPAPPAADDGSDDESQMTFAQRISAGLKRLRQKGAPAPGKPDTPEENT